MSDDSKFDAFLKSHDLRAPHACPREWESIRACIDEHETPWIQVVLDSMRSLDFWAPSLGLSTLALAGVVIFTQLDTVPTTTDTVSRIAEVYTTDLISSTAYEFK